MLLSRDLIETWHCKQEMEWFANMTPELRRSLEY